ncbi:MAG: hypothetical protein N3G76_01510 [Candidatus Micrarchaeota archaeon]|nr:hypothetical protein [Candidatus Micrarchaeota archaeon]
MERYTRFKRVCLAAASIAACAHMQFCDAKLPSERWDSMSSNAQLVKPTNSSLTNVPVVNYNFTMEDLEKYLTVENFKGNNKEAKDFANKLAASGLNGFLLLNEYLIKYVKDENRAPVAIGLMLKMYKERMTIALSIESAIDNNISADDPNTFEAGCKLLYHMIRKFPPENGLGEQFNMHRVDYDRLLGKLIGRHNSEKTPTEIKKIAGKYLLMIRSELKKPDSPEGAH